MNFLLHMSWRYQSLVDWEAVSEEEVTLCVLFDGIVVEETVVRIHRPPDASRCRAEGDGLHKAVVGETAKFTVDTAVHLNFDLDSKGQYRQLSQLH